MNPEDEAEQLVCSCGSTDDVYVCVDPYEEEMSDDQDRDSLTASPMCAECRYQSAMDI